MAGSISRAETHCTADVIVHYGENRSGVIRAWNIQIRHLPIWQDTGTKDAAPETADQERHDSKKDRQIDGWADRQS